MRELWLFETGLLDWLPRLTDKNPIGIKDLWMSPMGDLE